MLVYSGRMTPDTDLLEYGRDPYLGRLFLQAYRAVAITSITKLRARGHDRLTMAHTALLPHLDLAGTSVTTLAERAGMTKQSMRQLVLDLEKNGYLRRTPDPADGRATLVTFTEEGGRFLRDAEAIKQEMQVEYLAVLGPERLEELEQSLSALIASAQSK